MSRRTVFAAGFLLTSSLLAQTGATPPRAEISRIAWLAGKWVGEQSGTRFEETWTSPAGGAMLAVSRTLKGGRMSGLRVPPDRREGRDARLRRAARRASTDRVPVDRDRRNERDV